MNNLLTENSKTSNGHAGPERDTNTHPMKPKKRRHSEINEQVRTTVTNNKGAKINHQNQ